MKKKSQKVKVQKIKEKDKNLTNLIECLLFSLFFLFLCIINFNIPCLIFLILCIIFSICFLYRKFKQK